MTTVKKRSENHIVQFTPEGYIIFRLQQIAEDVHEPMQRRERARRWYDHLTKADSPSSTPIVYQSGGRRRSRSVGREFAKEAEYQGYDRDVSAQKYA